MGEDIMSGFNLKTLDVVSKANEGTTVDIVHPVTGDPLGIKVQVVGQDSDLYRKAQRKILNKRLNDKKFKTRAEELENEAIDLLAGCTVGWEGIQEGETDIPFSVDAAKRVYREYPWMKEQVDMAIGDRGNFLGN